MASNRHKKIVPQRQLAPTPSLTWRLREEPPASSTLSATRSGLPATRSGLSATRSGRSRAFTLFLKIVAVVIVLLLLLLLFFLFFPVSRSSVKYGIGSAPAHFSIQEGGDKNSLRQLQSNLEDIQSAILTLELIQKEVNQRYLQREKLLYLSKFNFKEKLAATAAAPREASHYRYFDQPHIAQGLLGQVTDYEAAPEKTVSSRTVLERAASDDPPSSINLLENRMRALLYLSKMHQDYSWAYFSLMRNIPHLWPLEHIDRWRVSSPFGPRHSPFNGERALHRGIDLKAPSDTPVFATAAGIVISTRYSNKGYGNTVRVLHFSGYETLYAHLSHINIANYEMVYPGRQLGTVGSSGRSTGPHLHYEIRKNSHSIDPLNYLGL